MGKDDLDVVTDFFPPTKNAMLCNHKKIQNKIRVINLDWTNQPVRDP